MPAYRKDVAVARPKDAARVRGQKKYRDLKEQGLTDSEIQDRLNADHAEVEASTKEASTEEE